MSNNLVEVEQLVVKYRRATNPAVDGVSFSVPKGAAFGIVGESGSGKSTTVRAILRLVDGMSGKVVIGGKDVTRLSRRQMRPIRRDVQRVYRTRNPRWTR
jgi:ABC-type oligopeptide transport system ATPase subunit